MATNRCSESISSESKTTYQGIIVESFEKPENSTDLQLVCQEIANQSKKLSYTNDAPQVKVFCALIGKEHYQFDQKVKDLHGDYYEFSLEAKYIVVIKVTRQFNEQQIEETNHIND